MAAEPAKKRKPLLPPVVRNTEALIASVLSPRQMLMWLHTTEPTRTFEPGHRLFNLLALYLQDRNVDFPIVTLDTIRFAGPHGEDCSMLHTPFSRKLLEVFNALGDKFEVVTVEQAIRCLVSAAPNCADPVFNTPELEAMVV